MRSFGISLVAQIACSGPPASNARLPLICVSRASISLSIIVSHRFDQFQAILHFGPDLFEVDNGRGAQAVVWCDAGEPGMHPSAEMLGSDLREQLATLRSGVSRHDILGGRFLKNGVFLGTDYAKLFRQFAEMRWRGHARGEVEIFVRKLQEGPSDGLG